jgi:hypothetical protein
MRDIAVESHPNVEEPRRIQLKTAETRCVILLIARDRAEVTKREC